MLEAMPKQAERRRASPLMRKGTEEDIHRRRSAMMTALTLLQPGRAIQKLVLAGAAQQIVAAQQTRGASRHLAKQLVAGLRSKPRVPVAEVVDVEQDHTQRAVQCAVRGRSPRNIMESMVSRL